MRIVFLGSPPFAVPSLEALAGSRHTVVSVVTGSDKKRGRGGSLSPTAVKECAVGLGIPVLEADSVRTPEFETALRQLNPDLLVVVAFKILPAAILHIPKSGSINLHASLLPKYRGAAPIHWAVINGERETGNTVFLLNERVDAGAILARSRVVISDEDTTGTIYEKLRFSGARLVVETVDALAEGRVEPLEQDESAACPAPKVFPEMARIDFNQPGATVHNRIRGFTPAPGAWAMLQGERVKLEGSSLEPSGKALKPGELHLDGGKLLIGCAIGAVSLKNIQFAGKPKTNAAAWYAASGKQLRFDA